MMNVCFLKYYSVLLYSRVGEQMKKALQLIVFIMFVFFINNDVIYGVTPGESCTTTDAKNGTYQNCQFYNVLTGWSGCECVPITPVTPGGEVVTQPGQID